MSTARYTVRQMVGRMMAKGSEPVMKTGVPGGGFSTTGFTCAALALLPDDFLNTWKGRFYLGTHKDVDFEVTDFASSGGTTTIGPATTGAIDGTDYFELHRDYSPEEINNAINVAIGMVEREALSPKSDETLLVADDTIEYTVPAGYYTISEIYQEDDAATDDYSPKNLIDPLAWRIYVPLVATVPTPKIWFDDRAVDLVSGCNLRLVGQQKAPQLATDAATTDVPLDYLVQQVKALLHQSRGEWEDAKYAMSLASMARQNLRVQPEGQVV